MAATLSEKGSEENPYIKVGDGGKAWQDCAHEITRYSE
jgi:hypothetical protein